ncbi:ABC transporter ATP-binding protein [Streptomyces sp. M19]
MLLATVVLMALTDVTMVLVLLAIVVLGAGVEWLALRRLYRATEATQAGVGEMLTGLQRVLVAFRTVKAFGTEAREARHVVGQAEDAYRQGVRSARWSAAVGALGGVIMDLMFLTALGMGASRIAAGTLSISDLVAFLLYVMYLRAPVGAMIQAAGAVSEGLAALGRVQRVLDIPAEPEAGDTKAPPVPAPAGDLPPTGIVLDEVSAGYGGTAILSGISLHVPRGLTVVTGPSGIGKTTLLNLVERFLEADRGRVFLDGVDIRAFRRSELRRRLAYVEQDARCSAPRSGRPCATEPAAPTTARSSTPSGPSGSPSGWPGCRAAWTPRSTNAPSRSPADSGSGWRWRGPCCAAPTCCCWTR